MHEETLKARVGILVVVSHFISVILIVALFFNKGFLFDEMTTAVALILPLFSIYTTVILKYSISRKYKSNKGRQVNAQYVLFSFLVPLLFIASLLSIILLKAYNIGFTSFDQFKYFLGLLEVVFGVYMGLVLSSMFQREEAPTKNRS